MAWGMIGGAAVSVVGGALLNDSNKSSYSSAPSAGNAANSPTTMADPFGPQRYQYMPMLQQFMTDGTHMDGNAGGQQLMNFYASGGNAQPLFNKAEEMLQPGYDFNSSDPSYQWRLDQGSRNLQRNAAAGGSLASGNVLAALQDYGQHQASQEFQNEYQRRMAAATAQAGQDAAGFGEANQLNQMGMQQNSNIFNRLALLSGAMTGSPTAASDQLARQQAGAAAQVDKYGNLLGKAGTAIWNYATGDGSSGSGSGSDVFTPTTDYASQMFGGDTYSGGNFGSPLLSGGYW